jgi:hypothetical protein
MMKVPAGVALMVRLAPVIGKMNEINVEPYPMTVTRPPGLTEATRASPTLHRPALVTSLVVLSLNVAVAVSWDVSPIAVNVTLPSIVTRVTPGGDGVGGDGVTGTVGDVGVEFPPQPQITTSMSGRR